MSFNNRNNLPNPSAPWGREVEQRIESAERSISQTSRASSNALGSMNNTLNTLASQQALLAANSEVFRLKRSLSPAKYLGETEFINMGYLPLPIGKGDFLVYANIYPYSQRVDDYFEGICSLQILGITHPSVVGTTNMVVGSGTQFVGHISGSITPVLLAIINTDYISQGDVLVQVVLTFDNRITPFVSTTGVDVEVSVQPRYTTLN